MSGEATCTATERRFLNRLKDADVIFALTDDGPTTWAWMRGFNERPPARFEVEYGHIDGDRVVRRLKLTMGLTAKQFAEAVERGKEADAA